VGDFNRDGHTDILWRHIGNGDNAVWYMNSGDIGLINFIEPLTDLDWQIQGIDDF
jgi:hypothetical protein